MPTAPDGQSGGGPDRARSLSGLVQPDHPVVQGLVASAGCDHGLPHDALVTGLCAVLGTWQFAARFGPSSYDEVSAERAGNCIDLSALLCAVLRRCGVERCYVLLGSRRGRFPAAVHAWVLAEAGTARWLLVDPEYFEPQPCDLRDLGRQLTLLAVFNDRELIVGAAEHERFFETMSQGGDPEDAG